MLTRIDQALQVVGGILCHRLKLDIAVGLHGTGPVQPDGNIKLETVAQYAANYLQSLVNASKQKEAQQNGSEP